MRRKDKRRIEELEMEVGRLHEIASAVRNNLTESIRVRHSLEEKLQSEKEKYSQLLERHIKLMESVIRDD